MKFRLRRPCPKCPFRRDCLKGWLGRARASEIADAILEENLTFACHETTHHADTEDGEQHVPTPAEEHCVGAIILVEREGKPNSMLQIAERLGIRDSDRIAPDAPELVFESREDFVDHHSNDRRAA